MSAVLSPPAPVSAGVDRVAGKRGDFADWLSPMLVKELRQGMRSRVFVASFLLLQLAMFLLALGSLTTAAGDGQVSGVTSLFWTIVGVPLTLIMPLAGLSAIGSEAKVDTLELIFLTRLTARRIIFGKWLSLVAQSFLLVCALLPHMVLRYFLGGVDLPGELATLGALFCYSAVLTAITVGLSPFPSRLLRVVLVLVFIAVINLGGASAAFFLFGGGRSLFPSFGSSHTLLGALMPHYTLMIIMLEVSSAKLAPSAENHTTSIRILSVLVLFAGVGIALQSLNTLKAHWMTFFMGAAMMLLTILIGLSERPDRPASLYRPFVRWGWAGRVAGRLLYPGWPAAVLYSLAVTISLAGLLHIFGDKGNASLGFTYWSVKTTLLLGSAFLPFALLRAFAPGAKRPFVWFLLINGIFALIFFVSSVLSDSSSKVEIFFSKTLPITALILGMETLPGKLLSETLVALIITALSALVLLWRSLPAWRRISATERQAALLNTKAPTGPVPATVAESQTPPENR